MTGRKRALEPNLKSGLLVDPAERPLWELLGLAALKPTGKHCFRLQLEQEVPSGLTSPRHGGVGTVSTAAAMLSE